MGVFVAVAVGAGVFVAVGAAVAMGAGVFVVVGAAVAMGAGVSVAVAMGGSDATTPIDIPSFGAVPSARYTEPLNVGE